MTVEKVSLVVSATGSAGLIIGYLTGFIRVYELMGKLFIVIG